MRLWESMGRYEGSINNDLERFLINLRNQKVVKEKIVWSFFTPKLTNEELKLVQEGNEEHLKTYEFHDIGLNPDVDVEEMKKSDSKSKYVHGWCRRRTIPLTLETSQFEDEFQTEDKSETEDENESVIEGPDEKRRKMSE